MLAPALSRKLTWRIKAECGFDGKSNGGLHGRSQGGIRPTACVRNGCKVCARVIRNKESRLCGCGAKGRNTEGGGLMKEEEEEEN